MQKSNRNNQLASKMSFNKTTQMRGMSFMASKMNSRFGNFDSKMSIGMSALGSDFEITDDQMKQYMEKKL